ncbi:hypothetical protein EK21DRAFT_87503 [Setomelanomma holmii]|uniref:NmrA-like domain-containing protein n=1 Tax=Setomelanomma holmii TaxID=210430 RepID=A0A9P4HBW7_9PLEO|nr:hypothetical protein EK21DRAFT_87503 [Setomelanomma holmii]
MTLTILVIGATGNTGQSVVRHLPQLLEHSTTKYRIVGLTRSLDSPTTQKFAKIQMSKCKRDWTTIDASWLRSQSVTNLAADVRVAMIDPEDVGTVGAHLLALTSFDLSLHNGKRYVLSGPEDVTGESVLALVEKYAGVKVESVKYKDTE